MNTGLMNALMDMLLVLGIAVVFALIILFVFLAYWLVWTGLYAPINKKLKYDEKVNELNKEFNKLNAEFADLMKFTDEQKEVYEKYVLKKNEVQSEINKLENEIQRKQVVAESYDKDFKHFKLFIDSPEGLKWLMKVKKEEAAEKKASENKSKK